MRILNKILVPSRTREHACTFHRTFFQFHAGSSPYIDYKASPVHFDSIQQTHRKSIWLNIRGGKQTSPVESLPELSQEAEREERLSLRGLCHTGATSLHYHTRSNKQKRHTLDFSCQNTTKISPTTASGVVAVRIWCQN